MVLVAEKDEKIVGVRAFMQWRWQINHTMWQAYRAVDTATHPDYQRQGIFKKLTLNALEQAGKQGDAFVFNTPNDNSRPGYLKMGWQAVGKLKLAIVPVVFYFDYWFSKKKYIFDESNLSMLCHFHNAQLEKTGKLFTPKSVSYLQWRYKNNVMQDYKIFNHQNFYVAYYIKKHRFFKELRVVEIIKNNKKNTNKTIKKLLVKAAVENRCLILTVSDKNLFKRQFYGSFGPVLTFKNLTNQEKITQKALKIDNWHYNLGDLELF